MALQSPDCLVLDGLSILDDPRPNPAQPVIASGVHLRWAFGRERAFPLHGYYLFRRAHGDPSQRCLSEVMFDLPAGPVKGDVLQTAYGRVTGTSLLLTEDFEPRSQREIDLAGGGIRLDLPQGLTASRAVATIGFRPLGPEHAEGLRPLPPGIAIVAVRGTDVVAAASVRGAPGEVVTAELEADGISSFVIGGGPAALVDLCYWPEATVIAPLSASPGDGARASSRWSDGGVGAGWTSVPGFPSPLTLPITHPAYPASAGVEVLSARRTLAAQRIKYGTAAAALPAQSPIQGSGKVTLAPGSALVKGEGTAWDESLVGRMLYPVGTDTAMAIMTVLAPNRLVVSRPYTGTQPLQKVAYRLADEDVFAQLHDLLGALLSEPAGMQRASMPPVLELSTATRGVLPVNGSRVVTGQGTTWKSDLKGLLIELGPGLDVYRIASVDSPQQVTLHAEYAGPPLPPGFPLPYRILSRSPNNRIEDEPAINLRPLDLVELAAFSPPYAQVLGLSWQDTSAEPGRTYDYMLLADHDGRFHRDGATALAWLNGSPDFAGAGVDGALLGGITHSGSGALPAPTSLQVFTLPAGRLRSAPDRPDLADTTPGFTIHDLATWSSLRPEQRPLMLEIWRASLGTTTPPLGSPPPPQSYAIAGDRFLPSPRASLPDAPRPPGWPDPAQVHYLDAGDGSGLDVGWYSYRAVAIDAYGRLSALSPPIPWLDRDGTLTLHPYAIQLEELTPPPAPTDVMAWILEPDKVIDPTRVADAAYTAWRAKVGAGVVGLRVRWRWPWSHQLRAPDLTEFRVYAQSKPLNAQFHRIVSVAPEPGNPTRSMVTLAAADSQATDDYQGATLQVGERGYPVERSSGGAKLQLLVRNGGPTGAEAAPSGHDATIVLPPKQKLHRDLFDPLLWERWLGAVAQEAPANATVRYTVDTLEDPSVVLYDDPSNPLRGDLAQWNQSVLELTDLTSRPLLSEARPGIDVVALGSDTLFAVLEIASVQANSDQVTPAAPTPKWLASGTYRWAIGPAEKLLRGSGARWTAATRTLRLPPAPKLDHVRPGIDRVYLRVTAASTPKNLQHFFDVKSVDVAQRRLVLNGKVSLLTDGKRYEWHVGTPARLYEAFFPSAQASLDDPDILAWLPPSLPEPVVYGTIGVSAADKRTEVADKRTEVVGVRPARSPPRGGNEGTLGGPATVFRVHREEPDPPADGAWDAERLTATRADYHGKSYFTVRWPKPDATKKPFYKALIFRASEETLFMVDRERQRTFPLFAPDDPRPAHWSPTRKAAVAVALAEESEYAKHRSDPDPAVALKAYRQLGDDALSVLANLPGNDEAFAQITIEPLDLTSPANDDRRGPDDSGTAAAPQPGKLHSWLDTLPGRVQNRYLYKIAYVDSAQNRGPLSKASPPVYLPKVVPPRTPVITKIVGGDRKITIHWAANREPDLAGYRVYRTDDKEKTGDVRLMKLAATAPAATATGAVIWVDAGVPATPLLYYRVAAFNQSSNESFATPPVVGQAFDDSTLAPPTWSPVAPGPNGSLALSWVSPNPDLTCIVERSIAGQEEWKRICRWLDRGNYHFIDAARLPEHTYDYRLRVMNSGGRTNSHYLVLRHSP